jgi:hypothetical protein
MEKIKEFWVKIIKNNFVQLIKENWLKTNKKIKEFWTKIIKSDFIQTYKEEIVIIPIILLIYYILNSIFIKLFPNSAFFDYVSEIETIISRSIRVFIALFIAHIALRVSFPNVYKYLHQSIYFKFDEIDKKTKDFYSIVFIIIFIISTALIFAR